MKKYVLKMLIPIMSLAIVYSCSKDELNKDEGTQGKTYKSASTDYLDNYYGVSYSIGSAIATTDENGRTFEVFPVTLSGDSEARGYLALDQLSSDLVYFADVDRTSYILDVEDIENEETFQFQSINTHSEWSSSNEFDFMIIIDDYNTNLPSGRKFFGRDEYNVGPCLWGKQMRSYDFYIFFIKVSEGNELPDRPC